MEAATTESTTLMTWSDVLGHEKEKPYFKKILATINEERANGQVIYPRQEDTFNALKMTPFEQVKVVIIGQDPYHGPNQAMGLCFSVNPGIKVPPSLVNIYKELHDDLSLPIPTHGSLINWAKQGVLLLNATLSVRANQAASHANIGWQQFTDTVIQTLNKHPKPIVYLLWGAYAQKKSALIDTNKHYILKAPHPSPLSAHRGFLGCKHFSKANTLLEQCGREKINWAV